MTTAEPIHPGEHLAELMNELGIIQYRGCRAGSGRGRPLAPGCTVRPAPRRPDRPRCR